MPAPTVGVFDETMMRCEDANVFMRLVPIGRCAFSRDVVMHKRMHDSNLSHDRHRLAFSRGTAASLSKTMAMRGDLSPGHAAALRGAAGAALDA